jgi:hypothetical protein
MIFSFNGEAGQSNYHWFIFLLHCIIKQKTNTTMSEYFQNLIEKL